ncbi:hypothetical protein ACWDSL_35435 [Streptomyces sp. NPDC000941]
MRDAIALALVWMLRILLPSHGRHRSAPPADQPAPGSEPGAVSPWSRPWPSPSKEQARALFEQQAEVTMELGAIRERRRAAELAAMGEDYPYTYPGAPFPLSAFAAAKLAA